MPLVVGCCLERHLQHVVQQCHCTPLSPAGRFFEDKIHNKEVLVEKLTLKNSTYKAAIQKLEAQLEHKEEMGEVSAQGCMKGTPNLAGLTATQPAVLFHNVTELC